MNLRFLENTQANLLKLRENWDLPIPGAGGTSFATDIDKDVTQHYCRQSGLNYRYNVKSTKYLRFIPAILMGMADRQNSAYSENGIKYPPKLRY
jgi:hypothetical protein